MARILIVEDDRMLAKTFAVALKKQKHTIECAYNGEEALAAAETHSPDLILLDLLMPRMGGIEFLRTYNLARNHPEVKVIVFSNVDMSDEIEEAFRLGASRYILKVGVSLKEVVRVVQETLNQKK